MAAVLVLARAGTAAPLAAGDHDVELVHGGRLRTYRVHVPRGRGGARAVVVSFHGGASSGPAHQAWSGLDRLADREGFLAVYPDGTGWFRRLLTWNAGTCCGWAMDHRVDDVGFVLAVLDDVGRRVPVDATRVYAAGMSNGAMMAHRMATDATDRFAAIAAVAGPMCVELFGPTRPIAVMQIHSVDDARAPYDGGVGTRLPFLRRVVHPGAEQSVDWWVRHDRCPRTATVTARVASGGHAAEKRVWSPCAGDAEVVLWKLTGPGHVWPGAPRRYPEWLLGPPTSVIDANEDIWRFFRRFRRLPG